MNRETNVDIAGQSIKIRTDEDQDYLEELASYVDKKIGEISRGQRAVTTLNLALTAALMIADELHRSSHTSSNCDKELQDLSEAIEAKLAASEA